MFLVFEEKKIEKMKHIIKTVLLAGAVLLASCASQPSLQEYYVDNSENPNFLSIDVPASILKMDGIDLNPTQKEAIESLRKFNLLAFKKNADNEAEYEIEKKRVREILKGDDFVELMKINSKYGKGVIKYLGDEDAIDEVIISLLSLAENGFLLSFDLFELPMPMNKFSVLDNPNKTASRCPK